MPKFVEIQELDLKRLENAQIFSQLPKNILNAIKSIDSKISSTAIVLKSTKWDRWYVIDSSQQFIKFFFIKKEYNLKFEIVDESPTISTDVDDYFIYQSGFPLLGKDMTYYLTGAERKSLTGNSLKKWDYFFRATKERVSNNHYFLLGVLDEESDNYKKNISKNIITAISIVIGFIILPFIIGKIITLILLALCIYKLKDRARKLYINTIYQYFNNKKLPEIIKKIEGEADFLENQVHQEVVSDAQIAAWVDEEIKSIDNISIAELGFEGEKFRTIEDEGQREKLTLRGTNGFSIEEWGFIQNKHIHGKDYFDKNYKNHLFAIRQNHKDTNKNVYGIYYITFIYLTNTTIGFSSLFYDFIVGKRVGMRTSQFYYKDIVSIGTKVDRSDIYDSLELDETQQIIVSFTNNEKIVITLTDRIAMDSLYKYIKERSILENSEKEQGKMPEAIVSETKSNIILKEIKSNWNEKKNL